MNPVGENSQSFQIGGALCSYQEFPILLLEVLTTALISYGVHLS